MMDVQTLHDLILRVCVLNQYGLTRIVQTPYNMTLMRVWRVQDL